MRDLRVLRDERRTTDTSQIAWFVISDGSSFNTRADGRRILPEQDPELSRRVSCRV